MKNYFFMIMFTLFIVQFLNTGKFILRFFEEQISVSWKSLSSNSFKSRSIYSNGSSSCCCEWLYLFVLVDEDEAPQELDVKFDHFVKALLLFKESPIALPISIFSCSAIRWYTANEETDLWPLTDIICALLKFLLDRIVAPVARMLWFV